MKCLLAGYTLTVTHLVPHCILAIRSDCALSRSFLGYDSHLPNLLELQGARLEGLLAGLICDSCWTRAHGLPRIAVAADDSSVDVNQALDETR